MKPERNLNRTRKLQSYSHSDYTGDEDTHQSVTGYVTQANGLVVAWSLIIEKNLTKLVTEY